MTTATIKLVKGVKSLDLMAGRYLVAEDFVPPAPATRPTLARGSSANRFGQTRVGGGRWGAAPGGGYRRFQTFPPAGGRKKRAALPGIQAELRYARPAVGAGRDDL